MEDKIKFLITAYQTLVSLREIDIKALEEIFGEGCSNYDPSNSGNFNDAYESGSNHSEIYTEYYVYTKFLKELKELLES